MTQPNPTRRHNELTTRNSELTNRAIAGEKTRKLAKEYGICHQRVAQIVRRERARRAAQEQAGNGAP